MALNEKTAAQRAFAYAKQRNATVDANFIPRAIMDLPIALRQLADLVPTLDEPLAELLRKNFTVSLVGGTKDLSDLTNAAEPMLPDQIVKVTFPGLDHELQRCTDEADLDRPWPDTWAYYAIADNTMFTRNIDESRTTLEGDAIARAGYVPLIASVPFQLEPIFIPLLARAAQPEAASK